MTNAPEVFDAGVCGIAVVGAIQNAFDPYKAAKELMESANYDHLTPTKRGRRI